MSEPVEGMRAWAQRRLRYRTLTQYLKDVWIIGIVACMSGSAILGSIRDRNQSGAMWPAVVLLVVALAVSIPVLVQTHRKRRELLESFANAPLGVTEQVRYLQVVLNNATTLLANLQHQVEAQSRALEETITRASERTREANELVSLYEDKARAARALAAIEEEAAAAFRQAIDARFAAADRRNLVTQVVFFALSFLAGVIVTILFS
jgi:hypothetical protein